MILQALYDYYRRKADNAESALAPAGFEYKEIPFILEITADGKLIQIEDTRSGDGKKKRARPELVPQSVKKTSGVAANLLWDNAGYVLGVDTKGKPERVKAQQAAFAERIRHANADSDAGITAVLAFLDHLEPDTLAQSPYWEEIVADNPNLTFRLQGQLHLVCQSPKVQAALAPVAAADNNAKATCLVTGQPAEIERLHPAIKGVWGAQSSGANIVSFNKDAFCSYHKDQGFNAPVGKEAVFAYTTALNSLLGKDSKQRLQVGDTSMVFWATQATELETQLVDIFGEPTKDDPDRNTETIQALYKSVQFGRYSTGEDQTLFYILGLAPNASRISIRFWEVTTVQQLAVRICRHFDDLALVHSPKQLPYLSVFRLLTAVALQNKADNIPPRLGGELMRSIVEGLPYPRTLLSAAIQRIRATRAVSYELAAIVKACLNRATRYTHPEQPEEFKVSLDQANLNIGYRLGRLFAVLEKIQEEASPGINATIRDRYYGAASSTPISVFTTLLKLKNHHLNKLAHPGRVVYFEKKLGEIIAGMSDFPNLLSLADQGRFAIGYYHQRQDFFTKTPTDNNLTNKPEGEMA